ncbi:MAG: ABC transporter permease, partial [Fimbriiglobus sp.]
MKRIAGVLLLLIGLYAALIYTNPKAGHPSNLYDVANRQGLYGILTLGAALLILSGGIDLSMGSVIAFAAMLFAVLIENGIHPYVSAVLVIMSGVGIGLINGLLVTRVKLQPFLVTLCGMFVYRGLARQLAGKVGLGQLGDQRPECVAPLDTMRFWLIGKSPTTT